MVSSFCACLIVPSTPVQCAEVCAGIRRFRPPSHTCTFSPHTWDSVLTRCDGQFSRQHTCFWYHGSPHRCRPPSVVPVPWSFSLRRSCAVRWRLKLASEWKPCFSIRLGGSVVLYRLRRWPNKVLFYGVISCYTLQRRHFPQPSWRGKVCPEIYIR